jgi:MFS family permease
MRLVERLARETFRSLRVRNFRLFFGGQLISQVGNWLTFVAQSLLVLELTDSGVALGALAAAQFGPVLLLGPWAGLVADRSDKRRLLLIVQVVAMVQSFVLAAMVFSGRPPTLAIYAVAVVGGITIAFDNPARRAFVVEMVPTEDMNNAVSLNSAVMTMSRIIGPALAGLLIVTVGFGWCFAIDGVSYVAVLAGLWFMRTEELRPSTPTPKGRHQVREGLRYVRNVPELFVPLAMMGVIGTLSYNFQTVFPLFAIRDLDGSTSTFTVLFSVVSVGALIGALVSARRTSADIRAVAIAAMAYGGALALMAVAPNRVAAIAVAPLLGGASIAFLTASTAIVQIRAAPEMRGRVLALQAMLFLGSTPVGGPVVGWVAEELGARWAIALGATAAFLAGSWGLAVANRTAGREPDTPGELGGDDRVPTLVDNAVVP